MTDLSPIRRMVQYEETKFRSPVSENTMQKIGSSVNFINYYQHSEKQFFLNGPYNTSVILPNDYVDGLTVFQFDVEIVDVWMFCLKVGSGGTTELDVKFIPTSGGAWTSIFSTTPKIQAAAGDFTYMNIGSSVPGTTAPLLTTPNFNAGTALRIDILDVQTGDTCQGAGILIHYRPR